MNKFQVKDAATDKVLTDDDIVRMALKVVEHRFSSKRPEISSPDTFLDYLKLSLPSKEHEVFCVAYLDAGHRVIAFEELFRGTLTQTSVYPREVLKRVLHHNAAGVVIAHNHPSGSAVPSQADSVITALLVKALQLIDVELVDHFIIGGADSFSFRQHGFFKTSIINDIVKQIEKGADNERIASKENAGSEKDQVR